MAKKGNLKRETESLLIVTQSNTIRTNHSKAKIDKTQQNSRYTLCGDKHETINHILSECSKLVQKQYKTRHDWVWKLTQWELCKKFKFKHTNKWYMHNLEYVWENEKRKLLWGFEIQSDHQISTRPYYWSGRLAGIWWSTKKKRTCRIVDFAAPDDHCVK